jgi:hypothetical protein
VINSIIDRGITSNTAIAAELNSMGIETPRGAQWYAASVRNARRRMRTASAASIRSSGPSRLIGLAGPTSLRLNRMDLPCSRRLDRLEEAVDRSRTFDKCRQILQIRTLARNRGNP